MSKIFIETNETIRYAGVGIERVFSTLIFVRLYQKIKGDVLEAGYNKCNEYFKRDGMLGYGLCATH